MLNVEHRLADLRVRQGVKAFLFCNAWDSEKFLDVLGRGRSVPALMYMRAVDSIAGVDLPTALR